MRIANALKSSIAALALLCAMPGTAQAGDSTLYDDLGGQEGLDAIVSGLLSGAAAHPRIGHHFSDRDLERVHRGLVSQLCEVADGSCTYTGLSMAQSHRGLQLKPIDFRDMVEVLQAAMSEQGVPFHTQNRLVARLAPMRPDIVTPRAIRRADAARHAAKRAEVEARIRSAREHSERREATHSPLAPD